MKHVIIADSRKELLDDLTELLYSYPSYRLGEVKLIADSYTEYNEYATEDFEEGVYEVVLVKRD